MPGFMLRGHDSFALNLDLYLDKTPKIIKKKTSFHFISIEIEIEIRNFVKEQLAHLFTVCMLWLGVTLPFARPVRSRKLML